MGDLISRETARKHLKKRLLETALNNVGYVADASEIYEDVADERIDAWINEIPSLGQVLGFADKDTAQDTAQGGLRSAT